MKRTLIITLLACLSASPAAFGGIGDSYYCAMVEQATFQKGAIEQYKPDRFTFRWKEGEIVFGKGSFLGGKSSLITADHSSQNTFFSESEQDNIKFLDGRFRYARLSIASKELIDESENRAELIFITANCEKFDD